jgi:restriction system protein
MRISSHSEGIAMADFYKMILGAGHELAETGFNGGWIGVGWFGETDLSERFPESYEEFRDEFAPIFMEGGVTTRISAGNICGALFVIGKGMQEGDLVITPTGRRTFRVGKIIGPYRYAKDEPLPHRRPVDWFDGEIPKDELTEDLQKTLSTPRTWSHLKGYPEDIQKSYEEQLHAFISGQPISHGATERVEESVSFIMEKYLEDFLVNNWDKTVLAEDWDLVDSQVQTETGPLDVLARSKDGKTLLVIELKLRRASDNVLGQVQRYMGWVKQDLDEGQQVRGLIIGDEMDKRLHLALKVAPDVSFMRYEMDFRLLSEEFPETPALQ